MSKKKQSNRLVVEDPYKFFLDKYNINNEDFKIDDVQVYDADPDRLRKEFEEQIEEARKTRISWVADAMENDPAFMVDPIPDYYIKHIPENLRAKLSKEQINNIIELYDPLTWAENNLLQNHGGFKARTSASGYPYQAQMIRCRSKRIAARAGRRIGKSVSLVVRLLSKIYTWTSDDKHPTLDIVIFTPNVAQIDMIFKLMDTLIDGNSKLMNMIPKAKIPSRKHPYHMLDFTHGASIKGFVSGSTAIRGQRSDLLVIDEGSFLTTEDTDAVVSLLAENKDTEFWVSSTPKGAKDYFYDRCFDKRYVQFYFPTDKYHPDWDSDMETEFRTQLTKSGYDFEVLAKFSDSGSNVFQMSYIDEAFDNTIRYTDQIPEPGWFYGLGADWNDPENGTQIYVIGFNPSSIRYKIVDKLSVHVQGWTQLTAVKAIRDMNRKWKLSLIYVDRGHGGTQVELLHELGLQSPPNSVDKMLLKTKQIDFGSVFEVYDPWQKKKIKKPAKPFMVNNAVRMFEQSFIDIPKEDSTLRSQLEGYYVDHTTPSGYPVYAKDKKAGDHALDAVMLCLLGFAMEYSNLGNPKMVTDIHISLAISHMKHSTRNELSEVDARLAKDKADEQAEMDRFKPRGNSDYVSRRDASVNRFSIRKRKKLSRRTF